MASFLWKTFSGNFLSPDGYYFWGWILLYIFTGSYLSYQEQKTFPTETFTWKKAIAYCFPKRTFTGPSAILDYQWFLGGSRFL
jgi:hypothetical protein